jgi:signal transduction histidine kinase
MGSLAVSPGDKVNILLVDDQPSKLMSYEVMLAELGERLIKAGSANEALEQLLRNEIAVILIDVCMPDLDGFELATMIREHPRFQKTALIFVSAVLMTDIDLLRGYRLGAVDYVPIPVVPELLRAKVRVFIELYRKTRQLELWNSELERRVDERTAELAHSNEQLERRVEERTQEREAALAQVHEMQKLESLGQLTGGVAHDFNNLLTVILGNLILLRKRVPDDPRCLRLIDGAVQSAERGASLTRRMLAFARRQDLKPETVDLASLVEGMADMLRRSLGPAIQISTEFRPDLPPIRVDPNQFELALLNLALNARDAMPLGGRLTVTARSALAGPEAPAELAAGKYVCVSVIDTGAGMDAATLKRAAEPFFTTKGVGKGTGLGLSMVHGLVAQSDGAMRIMSRPENGTTVELWLPAAERAVDTRPAAAASTAMSARSCRILLVDDDALIRASTADLLDDLGHVVIEAASGEAALEVLRSGVQVDLVITDQAMPGMTGFELARRIKRAWPKLPMVLATGYADLPAEADPGLPRLPKPYLQEQLAAEIARLTAGRAASNVVAFDAARRA